MSVVSACYLHTALIPISRFSSIRLLLTNTLVPRDTKSLVAGVSAKRLAEPHVVDPIMEAIQEISDEAKHLLGGAEIDRKQLISRLEVSAGPTPSVGSND